MKWIPVVAICALAVVFGCKNGDVASDSAAGMATSPPPAAVGFATVQPILNENCIGCHGADHPKAGLTLTSYESVMKGGTEGPVVIAGDKTKSLLIQVLHAADGKPQMPPKGPIAADKISAIEAWVAAGAAK